ncbi:MAG: hypothetical protein PVG82_05125 [Chromatiales bacterium]|jgi:hypothetical protein
MPTRKSSDTAPEDASAAPVAGTPPQWGSHIAIVAANGTVLWVNQAWLRFARLNGDPPLTKIGVGANYFAACRRAAAQRDGFAASALAGILDVLHRRRERFTLDYPCPSPGRPAWYRMTVTRRLGERTVEIAHELIEPAGLSRRAPFEPR